MPSTPEPAGLDNLGSLIYLGAVGVLCALLLAAYGYLLAHQRRGQLWSAVDALLSRRTPGLWRALKAKGSWPRRLSGPAIIMATFSLASYFFAEVTEGWVEQEELYAIDQQVYQALIHSSDPVLERVLVGITHFGSLYFALGVCGLLLAVFAHERAKRNSIALVLVMGVGEAMAWGLKWIFARKRPDHSLVTAAGDAFPSGHAFTAAALFGFLIYLVWGWTERPLWRVTLTALLGTLAVLVGVSRVFLRVHWFSDVLGGFTLGLGWLVCSLLSVHLLRDFRTR